MRENRMIGDYSKYVLEAEIVNRRIRCDMDRTEAALHLHYASLIPDDDEEVKQRVCCHKTVLVLCPGCPYGPLP